MDFLLELVFEIVGGILEAIIESDSVPKWLRYTLLALLFAGILTLIILGIIHAPGVLLAIFLGLLAIALLGLFIYFVYRISRYGILRPARKEELPEVLKMYRSVIGKPGCNWSITYPNEITLQQDFRSGNLYVLRKGKKIIGAGSIVCKNELDDLKYWTCPENAREIARIVIAPDYQGKGYGKYLVQQLCSILGKSDCQGVHLLVSAQNNHAKSLYRESGFFSRGPIHRYDHDYYAFERKLPNGKK